MSIHPSSSISFPCGDPATVQASLAAAGTAVTTVGSTVGTAVVAAAPVVLTVAGVAGACYVGYKFIKWLSE